MVNTMTPDQLLIIALILIITPIISLIWVVWWFWRHPYNVQVSKEEEGAFLASGGRYRLYKGKLFPVWSFFAPISRQYLAYDYVTHTKTIPPWRLGPITIGKEKQKKVTERKPVEYEDFKDYLLVTEALPVIGPKITLKLKRQGSALIPWLPKLETPKSSYVNNTRMVKINDLRTELWESTKTALTRNEMLLRVALPMGLIMLATILIIFLPKIITAIREQSGGIFEASKGAVYDWLGQNPPAG